MVECSAEMFVVEDVEGVVGVDGPAEAGGGVICSWELSSARTTICGSAASSPECQSRALTLDD